MLIESFHIKSRLILVMLAESYQDEPQKLNKFVQVINLFLANISCSANCYPNLDAKNLTTLTEQLLSVTSAHEALPKVYSSLL